MSNIDKKSQEGVTAIYHVHQMPLAEIEAQLEQVVPRQGIERVCNYYSSWGRSMSPSSSVENAAHYLAPLDPSASRAVILKSAIPMPRCPALAAVYGVILKQLGEGGELYVQLVKNASASKWATPSFVQEMLPSATVEELTDARDWLRLTMNTGIEEDLERLNCSYTNLYNRFEEFKNVLADAGHPGADPVTDYYDSAENAFIYSQHWALETGGIMDRIFREFRRDAPLNGLDIGGSYGFLACELAMKGNKMTNLELLDWRVEKVQPWLADVCGVSAQVKGYADRMENLVDSEERYDFVCFMGSLLCCEREMVPNVLDQVMKILRPGGLIILRENLLIDASKDTSVGTETRFTPVELHDVLEQSGSSPLYFSHYGEMLPKGPPSKQWTVFAALQKDGSAKAAAPSHSVFGRALNTVQRLLNFPSAR